MKKFTFVSMIVFVLFMVACGSEPQRSAGNSSTPAASQNPFGQTYNTPCEMYDDDDWFADTGIAMGSYKQKGTVQQNALTNAQDLCRAKVKHAYKGMISNFAQTHGNNNGSDIINKVSRAGDQIIDAVINDTQAKCKAWGSVDSDGMIEAYVGIKIRKRELSEKIAQEVKNVLTEDEKTRIDFKEDEYRKQMDDRFEKYKEEKKNN